MSLVTICPRACCAKKERFSALVLPFSLTSAKSGAAIGCATLEVVVNVANWSFHALALPPYTRISLRGVIAEEYMYVLTLTLRQISPAPLSTPQARPLVGQATCHPPASTAPHREAHGEASLRAWARCR